MTLAGDLLRFLFLAGICLGALAALVRVPFAIGWGIGVVLAWLIALIEVVRAVSQP